MKFNNIEQIFLQLISVWEYCYLFNQHFIRLKQKQEAQAHLTMDWRLQLQVYQKLYLVPYLGRMPIDSE